MTVASLPTPAAGFPPANAVRRFTVAEYHELIRVGVLKEGERVELLEGWIVEKMMHNPLHDAVVDRVQEAIRDRVSRDWRVRVQSATTTADSEPEPDVVAPTARPNVTSTATPPPPTSPFSSKSPTAP